MNRQRFPADFDEPAGFQRLDDCRQVPFQEVLQFAIADVACGDQQQLPRLARDHERLHEVIILGDDDALLLFGEFKDGFVAFATAQRKVEGVNSVVSGFLQPCAKSLRELRIEQKFNAARRCIRLTCVRRAA
jgi:hypothetical protein